MIKCYSRGSINAPIMIIGENPGRDEIGHHILGTNQNNQEEKIAMPIPFCGKAGKLLHQLLRWADIREGEYILTNIYKEALFEGKRVRTPTEKELLPARDSIILEIKKINPRLIITLGMGPIWLLCYHERLPKDELRMGRLNGMLHDLELKWFDDSKHNYKILPLYHPSAVARDETGERGYKEAVSKAMITHKEMISECVDRIML